MEYKEYKELPVEKEEEAQEFFCRFTFGQFFTILVLEVVTLAFVFYLGAKYGTNYLKIADDDKPKIEQVVAGNSSMQIMTPAMAPQQQAQAAPAANSQINDSELQAMARDALNVKKDDDLKARVKEILAKNENAQQANQTQPVAAANETQPTAQAEAAPQPASVPKPEQSPILMKGQAGKPFSVQVGSYPNMDEANGKVADWRSKGYPSYMMIADIPDRGRWYRVRIGGFATKDDAQQYLEKIKQNEGTEGIVVLNEQ